MKLTKTNLIAYLIFVLAWSLILYGIVIGIAKYAKQHPPADKPGFSEIRAIAEENDLTQGEVATALRAPVTADVQDLIRIILSQAISIGFTVGVFSLIRKQVSRYTEKP